MTRDDAAIAQLWERTATKAIRERDAAIAERDRLRAALEALRHTCRRGARVSAAHEDALTPMLNRIDAILSGG